MDDRTLRCAGDWRLAELGALDRRLREQRWPDGPGLEVDATAIRAMDTAGAFVLERTLRELEGGGRAVRLYGLRPEFEPLLRLVAGAVEEAPARAGRRPLEGLERIGRAAWARGRRELAFLSFVGETGLAAAALLREPGRIRWKRLLREIELSGSQALPILGLLSFLLGLVIGYQGGMTLQQYGAGIFLADMVGLSVARELAPLLAAIVIAGRTGSAYAAEIGTMQVTQEVDALRSIGIRPLELLVLPKMAALFLVMPLLTVYADLLAIGGGMLIAETVLGVGPATFINRLHEAVTLQSFLIGVGKAPVFALIIAGVGCFHGFQVERNPDSVGRHTTLSVVQSIFLVIVVDAAFAITFSRLGI